MRLEQTVDMDDNDMVWMVLRMGNEKVSHAKYTGGERGDLIGREREGCHSLAGQEGAQDDLTKPTTKS